MGLSDASLCHASERYTATKAAVYDCITFSLSCEQVSMVEAPRHAGNAYGRDDQASELRVKGLISFQFRKSNGLLRSVAKTPTKTSTIAATFRSPSNNPCIEPYSSSRTRNIDMSTRIG